MHLHKKAKLGNPKVSPLRLRTRQECLLSALLFNIVELYSPLHNGEKTYFSVNGVGKTAQLHVYYDFVPRSVVAANLQRDGQGKKGRGAGEGGCLLLFRADRRGSIHN